MAQIKRAKYGLVDMDFVLGVGGYDLDRYYHFIFSESETHFLQMLLLFFLSFFLSISSFTYY